MKIRRLMALGVGWAVSTVAWCQAPPKLYELNGVLDREGLLERHDPRVVEQLERSGFAILAEDGRLLIPLGLASKPTTLWRIHKRGGKVKLVSMELSLPLRDFLEALIL